MGPHKADKYGLGGIVDFNDQSILVASDIEGDPVVFKKARGSVSGLYIRWGSPVSMLCFIKPGLQGALGILAARAPVKLPKGFPGYNMHNLICSLLNVK